MEVAFEGFDASAPRRRAEECECARGKCVCAVIGEFIERTERALEKSIGSKITSRKFTRGWFDQAAREAVKARREAYTNFRAHPTEENWKTFKSKRMGATRIVARNKAKDWADFIDGFGADFKRDHKKLWQRVSRIVPTGKVASLAPIKKLDGSLATTEEEIFDAWADHYERLGTAGNKPEFDNEFKRFIETEVAEKRKQSYLEPPTEIDKAFAMRELEEALGKLEDHKASAEDGTRNPSFKRGGATMKKVLLELFNMLNRRELVPAEWGKALVVNLYKDGDKTDAGNYRGISLISCLGKLYLSMWAKRLTDHLDKELSDEQGGFRPRRSTTDDALTLKEALLSRYNSKQPTYLYFVDFRKAFDTVWHDGLWEQLWRSGVRGKAWRIVQSLYSSVSAAVRLGDKTSRAYRLFQGVRQGCPLSPTLFNCFIDELAKRLKATGVFVKFDKKKLNALLYADDVVLMAESVEDLQRLIDVVDLFCREWRMDINLTKSEAMVVGGKECDCSNKESIGCCESHCAAAAPSWMCRGKRVPVVGKYKYLGIWFNESLTWDAHIEYMMHKANKRSKSLRPLLTNGRVPVRAKLLVWLSFVRPLLEYGSEVWDANTAQWLKIESIQTRAGVLAMKINKHTKLEAVRALMGVTSLEQRKDRARLNYYAKLMTMDFDRTARYIILEMHSGQARRRGRQLKTWKASVQELIAQAEGLEQVHSRLTQSFRRNGGILPLGVDRTMTRMDGEASDYEPIKDWRAGVNAAIRREFRQQLIFQGGSCKLVARACKFRSTVPKFIATKLNNTGANQVRLRLLCGTSMLNETLGKYNNGRNSKCSLGCDEVETVVHFLLQCPKLEAPRLKYLNGLTSQCEEEHVRPDDDASKARTCAEYYNELDLEGRAVFMLGGPLSAHHASKPWCPEEKIDKLALEYVLEAYKMLKEAREEELHDGPVTDLTRKRAKKPRESLNLLAYFPPRAHAPFSRASIQHPRDEDGRDEVRARSARAVGTNSTLVEVVSIEHECSPWSPAVRRAPGSGSHSPRTTERT